MDGVHPFASTADPGAEHDVTLAEKIKREYFPYNESARTPDQHRPSQTCQEAWQDLDFNVRHLFRRAFDPDAREVGGRPSPEEWSRELQRLIDNPLPHRDRPPRSAPQASARRERAQQAASRAGMPRQHAPGARRWRDIGAAASVLTAASVIALLLLVLIRIMTSHIWDEKAPSAQAEAQPPPATERTAAQLQQEYAHLCDQLLMKHIVYPSQAESARDINTIVRNIQADRAECTHDAWAPRAVETVDHADPQGCFGSRAQATGRSTSIEGVQVPAGLRQGGDLTATVRNTTGRDVVGNIIIYWGRPKPGDNANCWLHVETPFRWGGGWTRR